LANQLPPQRIRHERQPSHRNVLDEFEHPGARASLVQHPFCKFVVRWFADAWHRAEAGDVVDEAPVTFLTFQAMTETLSPRRLELLRYVRQHGAASMRDLGASLKRDYKNAHRDVCALEAGGILVREGRRLTTPWNELQASINLAAA
jgi:predicted transcriptional regulator